MNEPKHSPGARAYYREERCFLSLASGCPRTNHRHLERSLVLARSFRELYLHGVQGHSLWSAIYLVAKSLYAGTPVIQVQSQVDFGRAWQRCAHWSSDSFGLVLST